jgi:hypothetical protein
MNKYNSTVQCNGLRARVIREVFCAATMPVSPERDALLAYWHERQSNINRIYYLNRLYFSQRAHPTKADRAEARDLAKIGNWFDSAEARAERRQLGGE